MVLQAIILGDDEGVITFYGLRGFPPQPTSEKEQIDQLLEGLIPGFKKQSSEDSGTTSSDRYFDDESPESVASTGQVASTVPEKSDEAAGVVTGSTPVPDGETAAPAS